MPMQIQTIKLDFPCLNRTDALHWLFKAEQFFDYYDIHDPYMLKIAAIYPHGRAGGAVVSDDAEVQHLGQMEALNKCL